MGYFRTHDEFLKEFNLKDGYWKCPSCGIPVYRNNLSKHLSKEHNTTIKEEYDKLVHTPKCCCGKDRVFYKMSHGYRSTCGNKDCVSKIQSSTMSSVIIELWKTDSFRELMKESSREMWSDPSFRDRISEEMKNRWMDDNFVQLSSSLSCYHSSISRFSKLNFIYFYLGASGEDIKLGITSDPVLRCSWLSDLRLIKGTVSYCCKLELVIKLYIPLDRSMVNKHSQWTEWRGKEHLPEILNIMSLDEKDLDYYLVKYFPTSLMT